MNADTSTRRRALGRGLDALIPAAEGTRREFFQCPIEKLMARRDQPRRRFEEAALEELAQSITEQGIIQPLVVRPVEEGFEIIAGERRWRAAQRAGLRQVPVVVQDVSSQRAFEMALVENLQREDLNAMERAEAYRRLLDEHGLKQDELAQRVGKGRSTIANSLRLLSLPLTIQDRVSSGELSEGHARTLLGSTDEGTMLSLATKVIKQGLSVRQTERLVKSASAKATAKRETQRTSQTKHVETRLRQRLGCEVHLKDSDGTGTSGVLELKYSSSDQLERILDILLGP
jgi:ParB family transcriptional regulator, chromosome partitioning protein